MNVAIIPARGGSRRIPHKNRKLFHGKPIIAYSIEAAKASGLFDRIIVTTDDIAIARIGMQYGAEPMPRSDDMACDETGTQDVMKWALEGVEPQPDYACCIYPCSPMMTAEDLKFGFGHVNGAYSFVFVPGWYYWGRTDFFLACLSFDEALAIGVDEHRYIDINTPEDFSRAEEMYAALHPEAA